MLKISCHVSKKVPIPLKEFSSQSFACGIEAELADAADAPALKAKAAELFGLVQRAVEEEIAKAQAAATGDEAPPMPVPPAQAPVRVPTPRIPPQSNGGNGNGRRTYRRQPVMATAAQKKAIASICRDRRLNISEVLADWNGDVERLNIKEASEVIDAIKSQPAGNGARR